jgi:Prokaryotic E2 family E/Multiubiquitin
MGAEHEVEVPVVQELFADGQLAELVVIEEFAKRGERPPHAKTYVVRIDKETYHIHKHHPTAEELLQLAGKNSATYKLYQVFRGKQPEPIAPGQHVDLHAHGIERFTTVPKDPKEGASATEAPPREFQLAAHEVESLDSLGLSWETIRDPVGGLLVLIRDWKFPPGYNVRSVQLALVIPQGYPDTQIDMVFFSPSVARADGRPINNLSLVIWTIGQFQQWSRHRTGLHPWRPGVDDISSHLALVDDWLRREFDLR